MKRRPYIDSPVTAGNRAGTALLWAGLLAVLAYVGLSALWTLAEVALLVLAAIVLAVIISALAQVVQRANVSRGMAVAAVVFLILLVAGTTGYFLLPPVLDQAQALLGDAPAATARLERQLERIVQRYPLLQALVPTGQQGHIELRGLVGSIDGLGPGLLGLLGGVFGLILRIFAALGIALYLSADPTLYVRGAAMLVPLRYHARALEVLYTLGHTLRSWLIGQMIAMLIVGVITWAGLMLLGIPNALVLGVIAGLLNVVPNFGPILSWIPAAAVALAQGPMHVLWVTLLFIGIQQTEGNLITPKIMHAKVDIPPVVVLIGQLVLATFFGFIGLLMAVPLTAIIVVMVKLLYVEDLLGYGVEVKGEAAGKDEARDELVHEQTELMPAGASTVGDDTPASFE